MFRHEAVSHSADPTATPQYKPTLTTAEKRTRNRPMLQFPTGVPIHFDKLLPSTNRTKQQREAIKAMERQGKKVEPEIPQSSKDLSMANRVPYVLLEYSVSTVRPYVRGAVRNRLAKTISCLKFRKRRPWRYPAMAWARA
jgi:hypothetical protein